ncbi:MAG: DUF1295 domain-containing protein [Oscillospiraceae bacterium]|nr:DUF1295 domain-containing protein [Oscillospiraceae bacterium]
MSEKTKGLLFVLFLYTVAFVLGAIPFRMAEQLLWAELWLTLTATGVIYLATCVCADTSLYDPYWSVAPPVMLLAAMFRYSCRSTGAVIMFTAVMLWSIRLTANWVYTFKGMGCEDWRYAGYRRRLDPARFALLNFFGFQLMPTLVTYAGTVGAFYVLQSEGFSALMLIGTAIMVGGTLLELTADAAVHRFLKQEPDRRMTCRISVWKYSRHPNYLGEILFWIGIFLSYVVLYPAQWYRGLGFVPILGVFLFASIPMMEKHNSERREDYAEYKNVTSPLLLLPHRQ